MRVTAGGDVFVFDPDRFQNVELMAIEKVTAMTAVEWQNGLNRGSMTAVTALIWVLRKRRGDQSGIGPGLIRFEEVVFDAESLDMSAEDEEEGKDSEPGASSDTTPEPSPSPDGGTPTSSPSSSEAG